jgi:hypothetical protein
MDGPVTAARGHDRQVLVERVRALAQSLPAERWEEGRAWYPTARAEAENMAAETGYTMEQCAAVLAHLSPRLKWELNVDRAWKVTTFGEAPGLKRSLEGALAALNSDKPLDTLTGRKTAAFGKAIAGDGDQVPIDVWMLRAFGLPEKRKVRVRLYTLLADVVWEVAEEVGTTPAELQAAIWCHVRGAK